MIEEEARDWLATTFGPDKLAPLQQLVDAITDENSRQNLIAPSTIGPIWSRHIADSAQLVLLASPAGRWLDIGSGAGLPGLVVAILRDAPVLLVEPRRQRALFLEHMARSLKLDNVEVRQCKVEQVDAKSPVISARAVASVEKLLQAAAACATPVTRWLLPRGRSGNADLTALERRWSGVFHMKQSTTDEGSAILVLDGPHRR